MQNYIAGNNSSDDEEDGDLDIPEFADFDPFMATFCTYKKGLSETDKQALMMKGLSNLRESQYMKAIIVKTFAYDIELVEVERHIFANKALLETIFNYMDKSFQLFFRSK